MKGDILHITLKPEDFQYRTVNPITMAVFRMGLHCNMRCDVYEEGIHFVKYGYPAIRFTIENEFNEEDSNYVKDQYRKDPKMNKCEYYVTLIEQ